jgi:hypothetical protein
MRHVGCNDNPMLDHVPDCANYIRGAARKAIDSTVRVCGDRPRGSRGIGDGGTSERMALQVR